MAEPRLAMHNAVTVLWFWVSLANNLPAKTSQIRTSVPPKTHSKSLVIFLIELD